MLKLQPSSFKSPELRIFRFRKFEFEYKVPKAHWIAKRWNRGEGGEYRQTSPRVSEIKGRRSMFGKHSLQTQSIHLSLTVFAWKLLAKELYTASLLNCVLQVIVNWTPCAQGVNLLPRFSTKRQGIDYVLAGDRRLNTLGPRFSMYYHLPMQNDRASIMCWQVIRDWPHCAQGANDRASIKHRQVIVLVDWTPCMQGVQYIINCQYKKGIDYALASAGRLNTLCPGCSI